MCNSMYSQGVQTTLYCSFQMNQLSLIMGQFLVLLLAACFSCITCTTTRQFKVKPVTSSGIRTGLASMEVSNVADLQCLSICYDHPDSHSVVYQVIITL